LVGETSQVVYRAQFVRVFYQRNIFEE